MNKLLTKIANDDKLGKSIVLGGLALSTISNVLIFTGLFYSALGRGFTLGQEAILEDMEDTNG